MVWGLTIDSVRMPPRDCCRMHTGVFDSGDRTTAMTTDQQLDDDARGLAELGYTQELRRGMSAFSNFAISFSIISILAGCITSYRIALVSGGALTLGWLIVGLMVLAVALAMAEICSRYPTAGGLYFWAGRLAKTNKRQWAWLVGPTSPRRPGTRPAPPRAAS